MCCKLTLSALVLKYTLFSGSSPTSLYPPSFLVCACSYKAKLKSGKREGPGTRLDPSIIPRLLSSKETSYSIYLSAIWVVVMATAHMRSVSNYCIIADTSHNWNTSPGKPLIGQLRLVNLNLFLCVVCG